MNERDELQALRRMAELEAKARAPQRTPADDVARDMGGPQAALANLGAGFDSAWQGARQLASKVGIGDGPSDDEIRAKRELDKSLSDNTTGGTLLQIAGEALPTMAIPVGGVAATGAKVVGRVAPVLGRALAQRGIANAALQGSIGGAVGGALGPTTADESRLGNMATGAALGGTLGGTLAAGARVLKEAIAKTTRAGGQNAAARELQGQAQDLPQALDSLRTYNSNPMPGQVPLSGAAAAGDAGLARAERGARARNAADFFEDDQARAVAAANQVNHATSAAENVDPLRATRRANWQNNWAAAEQAADPAVFESRMAQLGPNLQQAMRSPEASNPAVRNVLQAIHDEVVRVGEDFSPAHLQQIRANLNARGKAMPTTAWESAPRDSPAVNSIIQELDSILNDTTGGQFANVNAGYAADSRALDAAKAAQRVRGAFYDDTGRVRGVAADLAGDVPTITEAGLGRAMDSARRVGVSQLNDQQQAGLSRTLESLRRQAITQRVAKAGTAGGGSNTAGDVSASGLLNVMPRSGLMGHATNYVRDLANTRRNQALAEMLRDPQALEDALRMQARNPSEFDPRTLDLLRALGATAGAATN